MLRVTEALQSKILDHLTFLYGAEQASPVLGRLEAILSNFSESCPELASGATAQPLTERDAILITYGDQFQADGESPLQTLYQVLTGTLEHVVSGVHILPFFPYSSDDGFSIIDYLKVDADLGIWDDVEQLGTEFRLMFDAVVNHVSRESTWFQRFLAGDPNYRHWFIDFEPDTPKDWISEVVRPRALPLLTEVHTAGGDRLVWTTFSEDQIDLNYANPAVLLTVMEILLTYVRKGARIIRLDAIAYLWKQPGTPCIHLEETHRVVKLMRCVLDAVAPDVIIVTETNVPHEENISYFGDVLPDTGRTDEAQMVYQFPLAPLVMHSLLSGDARAISEWAAALGRPEAGTGFFNFTASHDGIGVMPALGLLNEGEIQALVDATLAHGGRVGLKTNPDGSESVYELNISYFDALSDPASDEPEALQVARFVASQAIMLALAGLPGIYVHSLLGSRSWPAGVERTGHNRTINRQKLDYDILVQDLADRSSLRHQVFSAYRRLLQARASDSAFHPQGGQKVVQIDDRVFALLRTSPNGDSRVLCLHNVSGDTRPVHLRPRDHRLVAGAWHDLLGGSTVIVGDAGLTMPLLPYAVRWLKA